MAAERHERLALFIQQNIATDPTRILDPDTPLISSGLVGSLSLVSLLVFIEDEFGVVIPDEAATAPAMNTIRLVGELIDAYDPNASR